MSRNGSQRVQAGILQIIPANPDQYSIGMLARQIGPNHNLRADITRSVGWFINSKGWLAWSEPKKVESDDCKVATRRLSATHLFWEDFNKMMANITLSQQDSTLFEEAVIACQAMDTMEPGEYTRDVAEASYLGRAAILGQRHDLFAHIWPEAGLGWTAIIAAEAARTPRTQQ